MSDYDNRVKDLLYSAECCKFAASKTDSPVAKSQFLMQAQELIEESNNVPKDYKAPKFIMPEWGTYGT